MSLYEIVDLSAGRFHRRDRYGLSSRRGLGDLTEGSQYVNKGSYAEAIGSSVEVFRLLQHITNRFAGVAKFTPIEVDGLIGSDTVYAVRRAAGWALARFNEHTATRNAAKAVSPVASDFLLFAATSATYMQIAEDSNNLGPVLRAVADVNGLSWMSGAPTTAPAAPSTTPTPSATMPTDPRVDPNLISSGIGISGRSIMTAIGVGFVALLFLTGRKKGG